MSCHNIVYYMSYHIISYHIISYHIISYHIISYHIISYHIISYIISCIMSCHIISYIIYVISYIISYTTPRDRGHSKGDVLYSFIEICLCVPGKVLKPICGKTSTESASYLCTRQIFLFDFNEEVFSFVLCFSVWSCVLRSQFKLSFYSSFYDIVCI